MNDAFQEGLDFLYKSDFETAIKLFYQASQEEPDNFEIHNNLSICLSILGRKESALHHASRAVQLAPDNFMCLSNLALLCKEVGRFKESIEFFIKSLKYESNPTNWAELGLAYWEIGQYKHSIHAFRCALRHDQDNVNMHVNIALAYLMLGFYERGFEEYLWRIQPSFGPIKHYMRCYNKTKYWNGEKDLAGKTILVYGEQGLGDVIQFARFIPKLQELGAKVIYHIPSTLNSVISTLGCEIFNSKIEDTVPADLPEHDYQCPSMSLPWLLKDFNINGKPYINWTKGAQEKAGVAVAWAGSSIHPNDARRSIPIEHFKRLFHIDLDFYGIQLGNYDARSIYFKNFSDLRPNIKTFEETATILNSVQLLIACDTSVVHLAGAMGVPCWVLVPTNCDWRWSKDAKIWYDSVKVFRQKEFNMWGQVVNDVFLELLNLRNKGEIK